MGNVGVGGRGSGLLGWFLGDQKVQVEAVCDTDDARRERAYGRVNAHYTARVRSGYKGCTPYGDFHDVLARDDLDAVVIATPDHWHGLLTVLAAKAGKDVYCEKPMASTVGDGRAALDALTRYGRVFQTGSHERSNSSGRAATSATPASSSATGASDGCTPFAPSCRPATAAAARPARPPFRRASTTTAGSDPRRGPTTIPGDATEASDGSWTTPTAS